MHAIDSEFPYRHLIMPCAFLEAFIAVGHGCPKQVA